MSFARKAAVFVASSLFVILLFSIASVASLNATVGKSTKVKTWISESGAYSSLLDGVLQEAQKSVSQQSEGNSLPIDRPEVQAVAKQAFSPELIQKNTETFIDGTYAWLEGKTPKPSFTLDFTEAKQKLSTGLGDYALNRYNGLPPCKAGEIPQSLDPLSIECRVPGFDVNSEVKKFTTELANNKEFLPDTVLNAEDVKVNAQSNAVDPQNTPTIPFYEQGTVKHFPKVYQFAQIAPYALGVLALLSALVMIFGSSDRRKGIRRVGTSLSLTGVLLVLGSLLTTFLLKTFKPASGEAGSLSEVAGLTLTTIVTRFNQEFNQANIKFGIAFVVLGVLALTGLLITHKKASPPKREEKGSDTPAEPKAPEPKEKETPKPTAEKPAPTKTSIKIQ